MPTIIILTLLVLLVPVTALEAANYIPLVGIPGVEGNSSFDNYITSLYVLSISIAGLMAVIKIVISGIKMMMSDVVTARSEAKKDIKGALMGLVVVLAAVLVLTIINPDITNVDLSLQGVNTQDLPSSNGSQGTQTPVTAPAPESQNDAYYYITSDDYSIEQQKAFQKDCESSGYKIDINKNQDGLTRCYKTGPNQNVYYNEFCTNSTGYNCGDYEATARTKCISEMDGTSFTVDPNNTNAGICIY